MKRISLMLALFLTLSFGMAFAAAQGDIYLSSATGLTGAGGLATNIAGGGTFTFNYRNLEPNKAKGITNGFEICGPGTWVGGHAFATGAGSLNWGDFDLINAQNEFSWTGSGCDTVGFLGSIISGAGMPALFDGPAAVLTIDANGGTPGDVICIDSCYFPPSGTWMWAYGAPGSAPPTWDGPHCYTLEFVPDINVAWTVENTSYSGDHCVLVALDYTVVDGDAAGDGVLDPPAVFQTDLGTVTATGDWTCQLSYAPVLADVGASLVATIGAHDQLHVGDWVNTTTNLNFTNQAPVFTSGCGTNVPVGMGNAASITLVGDDVDCDPASMSITGVTPTPVGGYSMVGGVITFNTVANPLGDGGLTYVFDVTITDGNASTTCQVSFEVLETEPFEIQIEKTHNTLQGMHVIVDVTQNKGSELMGGYDFMIAYDASALNFQAAIPGDLHTQCGWEYFNYRFGPNGNCGNACPSGMLEVVAIAETNNGPNHPTCFKLTSLPGVLLSLDFLVSDDRTLECQYAPIRFFWTNCTDNSIAYHPGDDPLSSVQGVSRFVIDFDLIGHIEDANTGFPTYTGVQAECLVGGGPQKPAPIQFVDFLNGGVDIVCADSIDARGDLNLNGVSNEIADAVLFSNYFVQGIGVFNVNYQGQVAASDVNADGLKLSVADLVYLIRVIVGDANPYPKLGAEAATYTHENGVMSVDTRMGAAFVVIEGNVNPTLLANNMEMNYQFDGRNTRVLVSKIEMGAGFDGDFLQFDGRVVNVEFATYDGTPVAKQEVPSDYSLHQNYPNPFNGMTKIAFGMPNAGDYSLTIYNVTGQKVADFSGSADAGLITVDWNAADQASGVYFYKLDTDNFTDTKKMVYLK